MERLFHVELTMFHVERIRVCVCIYILPFSCAVYICSMHPHYLSFPRWSHLPSSSPGFSFRVLIFGRGLASLPALWPAVSRPYARLVCCHSGAVSYAFIRS